MQNQYETVFIMSPVLSDHQMKETVNKFKKILTDNNAEIINDESWGAKKLAYPIKNKKTGYYQFIEFKAEPDVILKFETQFRRDEKIMRFLTFKQDKYSLAYSELRRNKRNAKTEDPKSTKKVELVKTESNEKK